MPYGIIVVKGLICDGCVPCVSHGQYVVNCWYVLERYLYSIEVMMCGYHMHRVRVLKRAWHPLFVHALYFLTFRKFWIILCYLRVL